MYTFKKTPVTKSIKNIVRIKIENEHGDADLTTSETLDFTVSKEDFTNHLSMFIVKFEEVAKIIDNHRSYSMPITYKEDDCGIDIEGTNFHIPIVTDSLYGCGDLPTSMSIESIVYFDECGVKNNIRTIPIEEKIKNF